MENIQKQINELKELLLENRIQQKEFLTIDELAVYLQLSKSSIYKLTSKKEIPFYIPGGKKLYFKKSEVDNWITQSRVGIDSDIQNDIELYLNRTNKNLQL